MSNVQYTSNLGAVKNATEDAIKRALEIIGGKAETNVKAITPKDTGNLQNSITHKVNGSKSVTIGSNVEYAPFVELGHHQEPGRYVPAIKKRLKKSYVPGKPFLRPGIEDHINEYKQVLEAECGKIK